MGMPHAFDQAIYTDSVRLLTRACAGWRRSFLCACFLVLCSPILLAIGAKTLDQIEQHYGADARLRVVSWQNLIQSNHGLSTVEKLELVNRFFNQLQFVSDVDHWGKLDYWATPLEMLVTNGGDCEDFSVAKYFTLRALGVPIEQMRLTYVKALSLNQAHMVITYFPTADAEPVVLDNLDGEIKPASQRRDLLPVYSFNGDGLWLAKERSSGRRVGNADRISLWNDLRERMRLEGLQ